MIQDISRIANRKYNELADDARLLKGWKIAEVAAHARIEAAKFGISADEITTERVYEYFHGSTDPRCSFGKLMEWTLGINIPFPCYWNAGKR